MIMFFVLSKGATLNPLPRLLVESGFVEILAPGEYLPY